MSRYNAEFIDKKQAEILPACYTLYVRNCINIYFDWSPSLSRCALFKLTDNMLFPNHPFTCVAMCPSIMMMTQPRHIQDEPSASTVLTSIAKTTEAPCVQRRFFHNSGIEHTGIFTLNFFENLSNESKPIHTYQQPAYDVGESESTSHVCLPPHLSQPLLLLNPRIILFMIVPILGIYFHTYCHSY